MKGKVLRVFNNDLYGRVDDRQVVVFASFIHKKYMNKYAIFAFQNEYHQNKLYYGSIHIKENSLVIFKVKNEIKTVFDDFLNQYTTNNLLDYELIDISNLNKLEIVGYNDMPYDKIILLDNLSIPKPQVEIKEDNSSHSTFKLIIPIVILIVGAIAAYVFLMPNLLEKRHLVCTRDNYHNEMRLNYQEKLSITFTGKNHLKQYLVEEKYQFRTTLTYQNFKDEARHFIYFNGNDKTFKYNDSDLKLIVTYEKKEDANDLSKLEHQLEQAGFECYEDNYEK